MLVCTKDMVQQLTVPDISNVDVDKLISTVHSVKGQATANAAFSRLGGFPSPKPLCIVFRNDESKASDVEINGVWFAKIVTAQSALNSTAAKPKLVKSEATKREFIIMTALLAAVSL